MAIRRAAVIGAAGKGETGLLVQTGDNAREPQNRRVEIVVSQDWRQLNQRRLSGRPFCTKTFVTPTVQTPVWCAMPSAAAA
jgi:hypothetical protein